MNTRSTSLGGPSSSQQTTSAVETPVVTTAPGTTLPIPMLSYTEVPHPTDPEASLVIYGHHPHTGVQSAVEIPTMHPSYVYSTTQPRPSTLNIAGGSGHAQGAPYAAVGSGYAPGARRPQGRRSQHDDDGYTDISGHTPRIRPLQRRIEIEPQGGVGPVRNPSAVDIEGRPVDMPSQRKKE